MDEATSPTGGNQLEHAASAYLRSARHQPVHWHAWGEAAFARAQAEDKPILLDIGAVWCHWCHVMDGESYEDAEIAALINSFLWPSKWIATSGPMWMRATRPRCRRSVGRADGR